MDVEGHITESKVSGDVFQEQVFLYLTRKFTYGEQDTIAFQFVYNYTNVGKTRFSQQLHVSRWLYFIWCHTSFSSIDHLCPFTWFLVTFHLAQMSFSQSAHLLMYLSLET